MSTSDKPLTALDLEKILAMADAVELMPGDAEIQRRFLAAAAPRLVAMVRALARAIMAADEDTDDDTSPFCVHCGEPRFATLGGHKPDCIVHAARALLGEHR